MLINNLQRLSGDVLADDRPTEQLADIGLVAADVARQLRQMAEARNVEIVVADSLPTVITDPARVELVLLNLVSNAIKYCDPSKATRQIEISRGPATHGWWSVTVSDNGLGIPAEALPSIFERFTRAHADRDGELGADGSGLGLAIVKESVEALERRDRLPVDGRLRHHIRGPGPAPTARDAAEAAASDRAGRSAPRQWVIA